MTEFLPAGDIGTLPTDPPDPVWLVREAATIRRAHPVPALPGVDARNADLVADLGLILSAAAGLVGAIADNAVETGVPLPAAVVASLGASLQEVDHHLEIAFRFARSEALPAVALPPGHRLPTALDCHEWQPSTFIY